MKILLAVDGLDGSPSSDVAVRAVARRPWPPQSEVEILTVVERPAWLGPQWPVDHYPLWEGEARKRAGEWVAHAAAQLQREAQQPLSIATKVIVGAPKWEIVSEAEAWRADLIVLGAHRHTGLVRQRLGSVSQAVAAAAHCSVEIVREPSANEED